MPLDHTIQWRDSPGCATRLEEGRAGIIQLSARKVYSSEHSLDLLFCKTTLYEGCFVSSKLLSLVVGMWERDGNKKFQDIYSFDNNGICLCHSYSRWENGEGVELEQHNTDVGRLIENGAVIQELIGEYPMSNRLALHTTMIDLRNNCLERNF